DFRSSDLDMLSAAGEIVWVGVEPLGERDGRIALYLTDHLPLLRGGPPSPAALAAEDRGAPQKIVDYLATHGASFFAQIHAAAGGFSAIYPVLKAMEESGRIRRGYFIAGLGATQFATAGAIDLLRGFRDEPERPETLMLAATDPVNPYGALVKWPAAGLTRSVGASVILVNGMLACYVPRGDKEWKLFLPEDEPSRSMVAKEIARALANVVTTGGRRALLITEVDDQPVARSAIAPFLAEAGFALTSMGYQMRAIARA